MRIKSRDEFALAADKRALRRSDSAVLWIAGAAALAAVVPIANYVAAPAPSTVIEARLIGHCNGRIYAGQEESSFPAGCDWIEPIRYDNGDGAAASPSGHWKELERAAVVSAPRLVEAESPASVLMGRIASEMEASGCKLRKDGAAEYTLESC